MPFRYKQINNSVFRSYSIESDRRLKRPAPQGIGGRWRGDTGEVTLQNTVEAKPLKVLQSKWREDPRLISSLLFRKLEFQVNLKMLDIYL